MYKYIILLILLSTACLNEVKNNNFVVKTPSNKVKSTKLIYGNEKIKEYSKFLINKRVAIAGNQTSFVISQNMHLVDYLISKKINVTKIFCPEHGFRGNQDRGLTIKNSIDTKTGIEIVSLFGKNKKPSKEIMSEIDVIIFDIQDVGARFYTYISSMHYLMEACAENNVEFIVFDRPNPLGDYFDGPVLKEDFSSFVGVHKIPVVHGLTIGELAKMINNEGWLKDSIKCKLQIIKMENYQHSLLTHTPIKPSPNLPNDISIRLYPSLCFFEATNISIGRGTQYPFQIIGYPDSIFGKFSFTPLDIEGMQVNPTQEGNICYGLNLKEEKLDTKFTLKYLIYFYSKFKNKKEFISRKRWFNLLAGNSKLQEQILQGMSEAEIRKTWQNDLTKYGKLRDKYLLYK